MREGEVEAGVVVGGVGVGELEEAVAVGRPFAQVLPGLQVGAGLDVKDFPGRTLRLQEDRAVSLALQGQGRVFDGDNLRAAAGQGIIAGDLDVAGVIDEDGVARVIAIAGAVVAL